MFLMASVFSGDFLMIFLMLALFVLAMAGLLHAIGNVVTSLSMWSRFSFKACIHLCWSLLAINGYSAADGFVGCFGL